MSTVTLAASAPAAPSPRLPPVVYSENQRRMRILASVREPAAFHAKTAASVDARQTASQEPAHPLALHHGSPRAGWLSVPVFLALFSLAFFFWRRDSGCRGTNMRNDRIGDLYVGVMQTTRQKVRQADID